MVWKDALWAVLTLYIKFIDAGYILILYLYVDAMIFTANNLKMITEVREAMVSSFEMTDLGLVSYFLGIEVVLKNDEVFISRRKYANNILSKFRKENSMRISTLNWNWWEGKGMDQTYYKCLIENYRYLTATIVSHMQGAKRDLWYIKYTLTNGICMLLLIWYLIDIKTLGYW